jgi:hypothetical protein
MADSKETINDNAPEKLFNTPESKAWHFHGFQADHWDSRKGEWVAGKVWRVLVGPFMCELNEGPEDIRANIRGHLSAYSFKNRDPALEWLRKTLRSYQELLNNQIDTPSPWMP